MKMKPEDLLEVLQAKDERKLIEVRSLDGARWFNFYGNSFSADREYRVRPEQEPEPAKKLTAYLLVLRGKTLLTGSTNLDVAIHKRNRYSARYGEADVRIVPVQEI